MANKRQKKKHQKQQQQQKLIQAGKSRKEVSKLSGSQLEKEYKVIVTQETKKAKDRDRQAKRRKNLQSQRAEKLHLIETITGTSGANFNKKLTARALDKLKLEDLQKGKYKAKDFLEYIPKEKTVAFDFDKVYKVPAGKKLHFAYRSLNGEKDIETELAKFSRYSNEELLGFLRAVLNSGQTRTRRTKGKRGRNIGSSGQAGQGMVKLNSQPALKEVYQSQYNEDRRANNFSKLLSKRAQSKGVNYQHSGIDYHWQTVRQVDEQGRLKAYESITGRKLLIIGNAIIHNITESDRAGFYRDFKVACMQIIPEMKNILP